jgi:hypothetical protein
LIQSPPAKRKHGHRSAHADPLAGHPKTHRVWVYREGHAEEFQNVLRSTLLPDVEIDLKQLFD